MAFTDRPVFSEISLLPYPSIFMKRISRVSLSILCSKEKAPYPRCCPAGLRYPRRAVPDPVLKPSPHNVTFYLSLQVLPFLIELRPIVCMQRWMVSSSTPSSLSFSFFCFFPFEPLFFGSGFVVSMAVSSDQSEILKNSDCRGGGLPL